MDVADVDKDRIMHVSLSIGSTTLMGSDTTQASAGNMGVALTA